MDSKKELIYEFTRMRITLLGFLRSLVRDSNIAEDIYQEACLTVLDKLETETFNDKKHFQAWVMNVVKNKARNLLKKEKYIRYVPSPSLMAAIEEVYNTGTGDKGADDVSRRIKWLRSCMEKLTSAQRKLIDLHYGRNFRMKEIGDRIGKKASAVQVRVSRIRRILFKCIEVRERSSVIHG